MLVCFYQETDSSGAESMVSRLVDVICCSSPEHYLDDRVVEDICKFVSERVGGCTQAS